MINVVEGNILDAEENIICQQVNCRGVMGSGLAKQIRDKYVEVYGQYRIICNQRVSKDLLGMCQMVAVGVGKAKYVANLFGQDNYGIDSRKTDYPALKKAFESLRDFGQEYDLSIAIPFKIGCSLAGGDWDIVYSMIESIFEDIDVTIYKYEPGI